MRNIDGYYYYAVLDGAGEYKSSASKVGIDPPVPNSYRLDRSPTRIIALEDSAEQYLQAIESREDWWSNIDSIRIGIALVEFPDIHFDTTSQNRENGFLISDFEIPLFSSNHYHDTDETGYQTVDERDVYGSMRDFYLEQTDSQIVIYGNVMNPTIGDTLPIWYQLPDSIAEYTGHMDSTDTTYGRGMSGIIEDLNLEDSLASYDAIAILHSGPHKIGTSLHPQAYLGGPFYIFGEKNRRFEAVTAIGIHTHEFGHCIGFGHPVNTPVYYSNMRAANANCDVVGGPLDYGNRKSGRCPGGFNPLFRTDRGWVAFTDSIHSDTSNLLIEYDYDDPIYYKVPFTTSNGKDCYYILENRLRNGFDNHTPTANSTSMASYVAAGDSNGYAGGLLIWKVTPDTSFSKSIELLDAGGTFDQLPNDGWDGWTNGRVTDYTQIAYPFTQGESFSGSASTITTVGNSGKGNVLFENITWNSVDSTVTLDIICNAYTSPSHVWDLDTLTANSTLYGTFNLNRDLVVPAGVTLNITPGATIEAENGKKVTVFGQLNLNGESSNPITFTNERDPDKWGGIHVKEGGEVYARHTDFEKSSYGIYVYDASSSADVRYCDFTNSTYGVYSRYNDETVIRNSNFENNTYGIRMSYSDCTISSNDLDSNKYGIYGYYSDFVADGNEVHNASTTSTSRCGMYVSHSNPTLERNDVSNSYRGLRVYNYSGPDLTCYREEDDDDVNNYIHDNTYAGIYVGSFSNPDVGVYSSEGAFPTMYGGGFNYFTDNGDDIYNVTTNTISAQVNWWEIDTPDNYGSVTTTYQADVVLGTGPGSLPKRTSLEIIDSWYLNARILEEDSLYYEAIALYDSIVVFSLSNELDSFNNGLIGIQRCYRSLQDELGFVTKMDGIRLTYTNHPINVISNYLAGGALARIGQNEDALLRFESSLQGFGSIPGMEESEAWALFDIVQIEEIIDEGTPGLGRVARLQRRLLDDYSESEAAALLRDLLGVLDEQEKNQVVPSSYNLHHPYPNPFNPSTTIVYELPKATDVRIMVHDILGREVWKYTEFNKQPGSYSLKWNGLTNTGKLAASGVYLISLTTPEYRSVQKAVLIR